MTNKEAVAAMFPENLGVGGLTALEYKMDDGHNFHPPLPRTRLGRALDTISGWDVAGTQPTHTATIVVERSETVRFTLRDGETPHEALTRVIAARKLENIIRHSEPRAI